MHGDRERLGSGGNIEGVLAAWGDGKKMKQEQPQANTYLTRSSKFRML
jgi:hypothetical protein